MATIKRFEDIEAWKKAREFSKEIWSATQKGTFAKDYKLRDQINDSSGSVMHNIAEGFGRGGRLEFINFLTIAKGSNDEARSQLYAAFNRQHIDEEAFQKLYGMSDEIGRMLSGLVSYLNQSEVKGLKWKDRTTVKN